MKWESSRETRVHGNLSFRETDGSIRLGSERVRLASRFLAPLAAPERNALEMGVFGDAANVPRASSSLADARDVENSAEASRGGDDAVRRAKLVLGNKFEIGAPPSAGKPSSVDVVVDDEDDENATVIATSKTKRLLPGKPDASASTRPAPVGAFVNPRDDRDANHAAKRARVARNEAPRGAPAPEPLSGDHPPAADIASRPSALTAADEARARLAARASASGSRSPRATGASGTAPDASEASARASGDPCASPQDDRVRAYVRELARKSQAVNVTWMPGAEADTTSSCGFKLDAATTAVLEEVGVRDLYRHQKEAVHAALHDRRSVVVATPTASGKSLTYAIPLMSRLGERRSSRAMILFPLKALANDQLAKLRRFVDAAERLAESGRFAGATLKRLRGMANVTVRVCDGDTSEREREMIRAEKTQLILTNPDCLHHYILPGYPKKWTKTFWQNLEWVVVDEAHVHRGVAGSHFANVLRRVLRLCAECDNRALQFVCTSATISNPGAHVRALTTRDPVVVTTSGAPAGEKAMVLWQPPEQNQQTQTQDEGVSARRRSPYAEAADVVAGLVRARVQCLCFVSARKLTEVIVRDVKAQLVRAGQQELALRVDSYRAGYKVEERRALERRLAAGEVSALVCTSALEMGIDVGALDATVHVGVPETAAAMWQQAGRAGRRSGASLAVVVACERPLDAFYLSKPEDLFRRRPEAAVVDPANVSILEQHLPCAAFETPLDPRADAKLFDDAEAGLAFRLSMASKPTSAAEKAEKATGFRTPFLVALRRSCAPTPGGPSAGAVSGSSRGEALWNNGEPTMFLNPATKTFNARVGFRPHHHVMLHGSPCGDEPWTLLDVTRGSSLATGARELEKIEGHRAATRLYPRCVHLSRHGQFRVVALHERDRVATCVAYDKAEYTSPRVRVDVDPVPPDPGAGIPPARRRRVGFDVLASAGRVRVRETVTGYVVKDNHTQAVVDEGRYGGEGLPAADFVTDAVWFDVPVEAFRRVPPDRLKEAAAGALNLCVALMPAVAMCDARDVAGAAILAGAGDFLGGELGVTLYLYDTCPNGVGLAARAYDEIEGLWERALRTVAECPCAEGCPSCVQAGFRGWEAGTGKRHARVALESLLGTWFADARARAAHDRGPVDDTPETSTDANAEARRRGATEGGHRASGGATEGEATPTPRVPLSRPSSSARLTPTTRPTPTPSATKADAAAAKVAEEAANASAARAGLAARTSAASGHPPPPTTSGGAGTGKLDGSSRFAPRVRSWQSGGGGGGVTAPFRSPFPPGGGAR